MATVSLVNTPALTIKQLTRTNINHNVYTAEIRGWNPTVKIWDESSSETSPSGDTLATGEKDILEYIADARFLTKIRKVNGVIICYPQIQL